MVRAMSAWAARGPPNRNTAEGNGDVRRVLEDVCGMVTLWDNFSGKPIMLEHDGGGNLARILVPKDEADRWGQYVDAPVLDPEQVETGCGPQVAPHKFLEAIGQEGPIRVEYTELGYPKNLWTPFWHNVAEAKQLSDEPAAEPARLITGDILRMYVARHRRLKAICQAAAPAPEAEAEAAEGGNTVVSAPPEKQKTCRDILNDHFSDAEWDDLMSDGEPDRNMSGTAESAPPAPNKKETARQEPKTCNLLRLKHEPGCISRRNSSQPEFGCISPR